MKAQFSSLSNEDLENQPKVKEGDHVMHMHPDGAWEKAKLRIKGIMGFYKLKNGVSYLASFEGKLLNRETLKLI